MPSNKENLANRLEQARKDIQELAEAIGAGDIDARVLREFRQSVDHLRMTAWVVQKWLELQAQKRDAYSVLPLLTGERVRRATRLSRDLTGDLDSMEITLETEGLQGLYESANELLQRLGPLFGAGGHKRPPSEL